MPCEKLGALHLLSHAIFAFKANGQRGITDLAFNDPVDKIDPIIQRAARALVLTEWKVASQATDATKKAEEARAQIKQYTSGVLGDLELKRTRYVVIICNKHFARLPDIEDSGITYRHIDLCLESLTPSAISKRPK